MSEYKFKTLDLARELEISAKTLRKKAKALHLGINLEGRAGYRYSEADRQKLIDSLRPVQPEPQRKRRRAA